MNNRKSKPVQGTSELDEEQLIEPILLIQASAAYHTTPELMAGALYGVTKPISRTAMKKRLATFLSREVIQ